MIPELREIAIACLGTGEMCGLRRTVLGSPRDGVRHRPAGCPDLDPIQQQMIGEHACHHRFGDRNRTYADTGIVPSLGYDVGCGAGLVDRPPGGQY